jgi:hypothetical protein
LVVEDRDSAVSLNTNGLPLLGVLDSDVKGGTGSSTRDSSDTKSARKEAFSDLEETALNILDLTGEFSLFIDVTIAVHHVNSRNAYIVELKSSVVNSIHSELNSHIVDSHSRKHL